MTTEKRKQEHIDVCLNKDVDHTGTNGFEKYRLVHDALPELNMQDISLKTRFLDHVFDAPIFLSPITGGTGKAADINKNLAIAAEKLNLPMGVGSQRAALEYPELVSTFAIRKAAKKVIAYANLGAVQINYRLNALDYRKAVDMIKADALVLHLNPLQEAIQPEGDTDFSSLQEKIVEIVKVVGVPVIAKEVGHGISGKVAARLEKAGIAAIDVAGTGGTSWAAVEGYRKDTTLGEVFRDWGIPTAECIVDVKDKTDLPIIASGGIRTGIEIVKSLSLGAKIAGISAPLLEHAIEGPDEVIEYLKDIIDQIRIAMFCIGAHSIPEITGDMIRKI